jgi:transcriptional regulator with XRE-family HTH domain
MPVPGLAEALPRVLRALRWGRLSRLSTYREAVEAVPELDRYTRDDSESPAIPDLAALLDRFHLGFGNLERIQLSQETGRGYIIGSARIPATLLVERLDLGLRALRLDRRLTQVEVARAAGLKTHELSRVEDVGRREKPSLPVLDRLLRALDSSYEELDTVTADPLRFGERLQGRLRHAEKWLEPVVLDGRTLPTIVAVRLDLALLSMRLQAGKSRRAVAEAAGIELQRLTAIESPDLRARPSEAELQALLRALGVGARLLERAARTPLAGIRKLTLARKPWRHGRQTRAATITESAAEPSTWSSSAHKVEAAISEVRRHWKTRTAEGENREAAGGS